MRYLILSDIHANFAALQSVLEDADGSYDRILNCGDLVGYGPEPNAVVDWCRTTPQIIVRGNHDKACVGLTDLEWFNPAARASAVWTAAQVSPANRDFLLTLPQGPVDLGSFAIFHGSPGNEDEYLMDPEAVSNVRRDFQHGLAFFGHTHLQGGFLLHRTGVHRLSGPTVIVEETAGYLINPGSVGQPRDRDPRAAYAVFDDGQQEVVYRRVAYDVPGTYRDIISAGLPEILGRRLYRGV